MDPVEYPYRKANYREEVLERKIDGKYESTFKDLHDYFKNIKKFSTVEQKYTIVTTVANSVIKLFNEEEFSFLDRASFIAGYINYVFVKKYQNIIQLEFIDTIISDSIKISNTGHGFATKLIDVSVYKPSATLNLGWHRPVLCAWHMVTRKISFAKVKHNSYVPFLLIQLLVCIKDYYASNQYYDKNNPYDKNSLNLCFILFVSYISLSINDKNLLYTLNKERRDQCISSLENIIILTSSLQQSKDSKLFFEIEKFTNIALNLLKNKLGLSNDLINEFITDKKFNSNKKYKYPEEWVKKTAQKFRNKNIKTFLSGEFSFSNLIADIFERCYEEDLKGQVVDFNQYFELINSHFLLHMIQNLGNAKLKDLKLKHFEYQNSEYFTYSNSEKFDINKDCLKKNKSKKSKSRKNKSKKKKFKKNKSASNLVSKRNVASASSTTTMPKKDKPTELREKNNEEESKLAYKTIAISRTQELKRNLDYIISNNPLLLSFMSKDRERILDILKDEGASIDNLSFLESAHEQLCYVSYNSKMYPGQERFNKLIDLFGKEFFGKKQANCVVYGGFLRDLLSGREPNDFDLGTRKSLKRVKPLLETIITQQNGMKIHKILKEKNIILISLPPESGIQDEILSIHCGIDTNNERQSLPINCLYMNVYDYIESKKQFSQGLVCRFGRNKSVNILETLYDPLEIPSESWLAADDARILRALYTLFRVVNPNDQYFSLKLKEILDRLGGVKSLRSGAYAIQRFSRIQSIIREDKANIIRMFVVENESGEELSNVFRLLFPEAYRKCELKIEYKNFLIKSLNNILYSNGGEVSHNIIIAKLLALTGFIGAVDFNEKNLKTNGLFQKGFDFSLNEAISKTMLYTHLFHKNDEYIEIRDIIKEAVATARQSKDAYERQVAGTKDAISEDVFISLSA